jgi:hypothetical protein
VNHDLGAAVAVLRRVRQDVQDDLRHTVGIDRDAETVSWHIDLDLMISLLENRTRHLERSHHHLSDLDALLAQLDLSARDARDVEQIVDQPHEMRDLPFDDLLLVRRRAAQPHQLKGRDDRRERIAQLVAEHREKLVLRAIGRACLGREHSVLAHHLAQLHDQALAVLLRDLAADGRGNLMGDALRDAHLAWRKHTRLRRIEHEFAEEARFVNEGNEPERANPLRIEDSSIGGEAGVGGGVEHEDRLRIECVARPW